jgi:uncharacterized phage protein (TIGR01671 family)
MKREIKFRGLPTCKEKDELDYINFDHDGNFAVGFYEDGYIIGKVADANDEYICPEFWVAVDRNTVGQYTGLKDKNGREIYEGDLFEHRLGYVVLDEPPHDEMGTECGVVVLEDGQFGVKIPGLGVYNLYGLLLREGHLDNMPKDDLFVMKIAGNIYENPELLEGKQ